MIVVRVELWPQGDQERASIMGVAMIENVGGDRDFGEYRVHLSKFGGEGIWKRGKVSGFQRRRLGPWDLLFLALRNIVGARNP